MPKGEGNRIKAVPGNDQPYLFSLKDVPDSPGLDPVTVDFELKRGVWIEGKVTDKVTGKPVQRERELFLAARQPEPRKPTAMPPMTSPRRDHEDGSYRVAGMPGPGVVAVHASWTVTSGPTNGTTSSGSRRSSIPTMPLPTMNYTAIARIDPARARNR